MSYSYGAKSVEALNTSDDKIKRTLELALSFGLIDLSVIYGHRTPDEQFEFFKKGRELRNGIWVIVDEKRVVTNKDGFDKLSTHNYYPSKSVDVFPYVNGKISFDQRHCIFAAGVILSAGKITGTPLRWGGNWDMDGEPITDQDFQDLGHVELID